MATRVRQAITSGTRLTMPFRTSSSYRSAMSMPAVGSFSFLPPCNATVKPEWRDLSTALYLFAAFALLSFALLALPFLALALLALALLALLALALRALSTPGH